jgi:hypothetical protein
MSARDTFIEKEKRALEMRVDQLLIIPSSSSCPFKVNEIEKTTPS